MVENKIITDDLEIIIDNSARHLMKSNFQQAEEVANSVISKTIELKDPYYAMDSIDTLDTINEIAGLAKAKILYYLMTNWNDFGISNSFMDTVSSNIKMTEQMIKRYVKIWETIFVGDAVPEEIKAELQEKPINDLVPIMGALRKGYKIDDDTWDRIVDADKNPTIARIIRTDVYGNEKESDALFYILDKISGLMYVMNRGTRYPIAKLSLSSKDEPAQRAIVRLIEKLNVQIVEDK